jgi:hypothetical protein
VCVRANPVTSNLNASQLMHEPDVNTTAIRREISNSRGPAVRKMCSWPNP